MVCGPLYISRELCVTNSYSDFWQSPSRFTQVAEPLLAQLAHGTNDKVRSAIIPCITALATAADSADNLKVINTKILAHLRAETPSVRLTAVRCQLSITEALGEEWLSLLPEMLPFISEAMEDDDEQVETEVRRWVRRIEEILGESLDSMLQ